MNRKAIICFGGILLLLSIIFTIIQNVNAPTGELNADAYQELEQNIDTWMPGIISERFEDQVRYYCRSERSIDVVQTNFRLADKPMSHNRAATLKDILDRQRVCL